jgi:hypothetical protein
MWSPYEHPVFCDFRCCWSEGGASHDDSHLEEARCLRLFTAQRGQQPQHQRWFSVVHLGHLSS